MLDTFRALTADLLTSPCRTQNTSDVSVLCTSVYFFSFFCLARGLYANLI